MSSDPTPAPPRTRWFRRAVRFVLASYVVYVAGVEVAVRSGLAERWANRQPHKLQVHFESAHSWFPFWGTVSGIDARGQAPRLRWQAHVDSASGWLGPLALLRRRVHVVGAKADGVELRVRYEPAPGSAATSDAATAVDAGEAPQPTPPIPHDQLPTIAALADPPPGPPLTPKWTIEASGFAATGIREIWLDRFRLRSDLDASGSVTLNLPKRELELRSTRATFASGTLSVGSEAMGEGLAGEAELGIERFPFQEKLGLALLSFVSSTARFEGDFSGGRAMRQLAPPQSWFDLEETPVHASGELRLVSGELQPGSRVEIEQPGYGGRAFNFHLRGDLAARFEVSRDDSGPRGDVTAQFANFEVRRGTAERPELVGSGLSVAAMTRDLNLAGLAEAEATAKVDLGDARLPDLALVADLLPAAANLALLGGSGTVTGGFDVELPALAARGAIRGELAGVTVRYADLDLAGKMRLELALATSSLPGGRFDLAGSHFDLSEFASPQIAAKAESASEEAGGWWARIELPEGELALPPQPAASGRLAIRLRDSIPFIGLFETRQSLPAWVERLLTEHDLEARARFDYREQEFTLDDFEMPFKRATIHARMRFGGEHKSGAMMIAWRKTALGLRFDDNRKRLKLVGVRKWYAAQRLDRPAASGGSDRAELFSEEALASVRFAGVVDPPTSLVEAEMAREESPDSVGAPGAGPPFEFVPGSLALGDLDGDGSDDAALLLLRQSPEGGESLFLAVVLERKGRAENATTLALSSVERPPIAGLRIVEGRIVLDLEPAEATVSSTSSGALVAAPLRFRFVSGALEELPPEPPPEPPTPETPVAPPPPPAAASPQP